MSRNEKLAAITLVNPVMIDACLRGAKKAKTHWDSKKLDFPDATVPDMLSNLDFIV